MTTDLDTLRRWVKDCDPMVPLPFGDPRYVPLDEGDPVRGRSDQSCIGSLFDTIRVAGPAERTCQLFTGFLGSGKSTELLRLKHRLESDATEPTWVLYVPIMDWVDSYSPPAVSDVLSVFAHCLEREATLAEQGDPDERPGFLARLWDFLKSDAELKEIGFQAYGTSLLLEVKNNPQFREKVRQQLGLRFQQFARTAHDAMVDAVGRIRQARRVTRVVVIADDLEKFQPFRQDVDGDREAMEAAVEALFTQHASWMKLPCHVIYTFPLWLRHRTPTLGATFTGAPRALPMVKIAERDGARCEAGHAKLRELLERRVDLRAVLGADPDRRVDALIEASGGYPRDLLRLLRDLLVLRASRGLPADDADLDQVTLALREDYELVVTAGDLELLASIAHERSLGPLAPETSAALGRLLDRWVVLAYRNGEPWYDVHPLVKRIPAVKAAIERRASAGR